MYGYLGVFEVLGKDWMIYFSRDGSDEYHNKWVFASIDIEGVEHRPPPDIDELIPDAW